MTLLGIFQFVSVTIRHVSGGMNADLLQVSSNWSHHSGGAGQGQEAVLLRQS